MEMDLQIVGTHPNGLLELNPPGFGISSTAFAGPYVCLYQNQRNDGLAAIKPSLCAQMRFRATRTVNDRLKSNQLEKRMGV